MKKIGYILIIVWVVTGWAYGQSFNSMRTAPVHLPMMQKSESGRGVYWGYCTDVMNKSVGKGEKTVVAGAIYIPQEIVKLYKGCRITGIRLGVQDAATDLSIFVVRSLGGEVLAEQQAGNMQRGWHEITFSSPYTLQEEPVYVGYTSEGVQHLGVTDGYSPNGLWLGTDGEWTDCSGEGWGVLAIEMHIEGDRMPEREMALKFVDEVYAKVNELFLLTGVVQNLTDKNVENYSISYKIGTGKEETCLIETRLGANEKDTFQIEAVTDKAGDFDLSVFISAVNGEADEFEDNNSATGVLHSKEYLFPRKVVVEEGTGTWCQYCPIGIVGFREMNKKYPDTFIGIAAHTGSSDPMTVSSYSGLMSSFSGYPECIVNRKKEWVMQPFFQNIEAAYKAECLPADAGIEVSAAYTSDDKKEITVKTVTTFGYSETNATYRIAYVLLENNVQGKTKGYDQVNAFAGGGHGEMGGFEKLPNPISAENMTYNDVARGIYKSFAGTLRTVPTKIEKGVPYEYSYDIVLPKNIIDLAKVEVAALLINSKTGEIVNADKGKIGVDTRVAKTVLSDVKVYAEGGCIKAVGEYDCLQVYTADGKETVNTRLSAGLYIVRIARGNSVRVVKVVL